jgi:hypothetical protein
MKGVNLFKKQFQNNLKLNRFTMKNFFFLLILMSLFACSKNDDITVHIKNSSNLVVKVTDNLGVGIPGAKVKLYDSQVMYIQNIGFELELAKTNDKGEAVFNDLNPGNYTILVDTVKVNSLTYRPITVFKIASSVDKHVTINVTDHKGNLDVLISYSPTYYTNATPLSNATLFLVPKNETTSNLGAELFKKAAVIAVKTDINGRLKMQIPCNISFLIGAYVDGKNGIARFGEITVQKDQATSLNYVIYDSNFSY